jgi:hypothetical protein
LPGTSTIGEIDSKRHSPSDEVEPIDVPVTTVTDAIGAPPAVVHRPTVWGLVRPDGSSSQTPRPSTVTVEFTVNSQPTVKFEGAIARNPPVKSSGRICGSAVGVGVSGVGVGVGGVGVGDAIGGVGVTAVGVGVTAVGVAVGVGVGVAVGVAVGVGVGVAVGVAVGVGVGVGVGVAVGVAVGVGVGVAVGVAVGVGVGVAVGVAVGVGVGVAVGVAVGAAVGVGVGVGPPDVGVGPILRIWAVPKSGPHVPAAQAPGNPSEIRNISMTPSPASKYDWSVTFSVPACLWKVTVAKRQLVLMHCVGMKSTSPRKVTAMPLSTQGLRERGKRPSGSSLQLTNVSVFTVPPCV